MSFWDAIPSIVSGVGTVAGAIIGANANANAADQAVKGAQLGTKAYQKGAEEARGVLEGVRGETAIGPSYLRRVIASPKTLTPEQQLALERMRRSTLNALHAGGLRGSGRATTAAIRDVEGDFTAKALGQNQARADNAASQFAQPYFTAGSRIADTHTAAGRVAGENLYNAGLINAGSTLATGNLIGSSIGDLAGVLAAQSKYRLGGTVQRPRGGLHRMGA